MHVTDGIVYLAQPLFGRTSLSGSFVVLTSALDFTFVEPLTTEEVGLPPATHTLTHVRVLIPLTNVLAVLLEYEGKPTNKMLPVPILERI